MHISVIIPVYNEGDIIKKNVEQIINFFEKKFSYEIIIIDDCSYDNTKKVINSLKNKNIKILLNKINKGKGFSIKKGIQNAIGDIIVTTDADMSADIEEFNKLVFYYKKGYSFVIGSRSKHNSFINIKQSNLRIFLGKTFNLLVKVILNLNYNDTQCGFKLYDSKKIKSIITLCKTNRFCSDVEILYIARLKKILVFEEGIRWNDNKNSSVSLWLDPFIMFIDLIKIKFRSY